MSQVRYYQPSPFRGSVASVVPREPLAAYLDVAVRHCQTARAPELNSEGVVRLVWSHIQSAFGQDSDRIRELVTLLHAFDVKRCTAAYDTTAITYAMWQKGLPILQGVSPGELFAATLLYPVGIGLLAEYQMSRVAHLRGEESESPTTLLQWVIWIAVVIEQIRRERKIVRVDIDLVCDDADFMRVSGSLVENPDQPKCQQLFMQAVSGAVRVSALPV